MKKSFMTRVLATGLSVAMAFSLSTATNLVSAEAATKPAMASKTFNLKVDGAAKNYKANAATQKSYKITKATVGNTAKATVKVNSSKKSIKVTPGSVAGSTVVTVTFKNNKTKKSVSKKYRAYIKAAEQKPEEVKVQTLTAAKQTKSFEVQATMALAATGTAVVAQSDFVLTRDADKVVIAINKVAVDAKDDTKVNITVTTALTDAKDYTLTYKGDAVASFKATDGVVTSFDVTPTTVVEGKETELKATKYAGDVIVSEGKFADSGLNIAEKTFSNGGYIDGGKVFLNKAGDTVKIKVQHDTGKFEAGAKVYITNEYTITASANTATVSKFRFSAEKSAPDWNNLKTDRTTVAMYDGDANNYKLFFQIKDSDDKDVTATCDYTIESADNTILLVNQDTAIDNDGVTFITVKTGKTYIIVKDKTGNIVANLPITVGAARVLNKVTPSQSMVYVTTGSGANEEVCDDTVVLTAYDQYGDKIDADAIPTVGAASFAQTNGGAANSNITLGAGTRIGEGTYKYTVDASAVNDASQIDATFPIEVVQTNGDRVTTKKTVSIKTRSMVRKGADSFSVVPYHSNAAIAGLATLGDKATSGVDTTVTGTSNDSHFIALPAVWINNNAVRSTYQTFKGAGVTCGAVTVKNLTNNKVYVNTGSSIAATSRHIEAPLVASVNATITAAGILAPQGVVLNVTNAGGVNKNLAPGVYEVTYTMIKADNKKEYVTGKFTIADTQPKVEIVVKNSSSGETDVNNALADDTKVAVYYGGTLLTKTQYTITVGTVRVNNESIYVKDADVTVSIPGTNKTVVVPGVSVNRTFTTSAAGWINR